jgi:hypothetical protein
LRLAIVHGGEIRARQQIEKMAISVQFDGNGRNSKIFSKAGEVICTLPAASSELERTRPVPHPVSFLHHVTRNR